MAILPTMNQLNANKKLEKLFKRWIWLQKSEKKEHDKDKQNRKDFLDFLPKLFDVASPDWESDIKRDKLKSKEEREEDLRFLLDQRGERKEWLGNYSQHYSKAFKAKEKREQQVERQKEKEEIRKDVTVNSPEESDSSTDHENDEDYNIPTKKRR